MYALDKSKHSSEAEVLIILIPIIFPGIIKLMVRNWSLSLAIHGKLN